MSKETKLYRFYMFFVLFFDASLTDVYYKKRYQFKKAFRLSYLIWIKNVIKGDYND